MARKFTTRRKNDEPQPEIVSEEELLAVAQGVEKPESIGLKSTVHWEDNSHNRKEFIRFRREVRRGIHKIVKYMKLNRDDWRNNEKLVQLHEIIDDQLNPNLGQTWLSFSDKWDIHPKLGLLVIIKEHWVKEGGGFDLELGSHYPHAFTAKET